MSCGYNNRKEVITPLSKSITSQPTQERTIPLATLNLSSHPVEEGTIQLGAKYTGYSKEYPPTQTSFNQLQLQSQAIPKTLPPPSQADFIIDPNTQLPPTPTTSTLQALTSIPSGHIGEATTSQERVELSKQTRHMPLASAPTYASYTLPRPTESSSTPTRSPTRPSTNQALAQYRKKAQAKRSLTYTAQGGQQVTFLQQEGSWEAMVAERLPIGFSRCIKLPVYQEEACSIEGLEQHSQRWHQKHIHVVFPEHSAKDQGYVYLGKLGLLGGGNGGSSQKNSSGGRGNDRQSASSNRSSSTAGSSTSTTYTPQSYTSSTYSHRSYTSYTPQSYTSSPYFGPRVSLSTPSMTRASSAFFARKTTRETSRDTPSTSSTKASSPSVSTTASNQAAVSRPPAKQEKKEPEAVQPAPSSLGKDSAQTRAKDQPGILTSQSTYLPLSYPSSKYPPQSYTSSPYFGPSISLTSPSTHVSPGFPFLKDPVSSPSISLTSPSIITRASSAFFASTRETSRGTPSSSYTKTSSPSVSTTASKQAAVTRPPEKQEKKEPEAIETAPSPVTLSSISSEVNQYVEEVASGKHSPSGSQGVQSKGEHLLQELASLQKKEERAYEYIDKAYTIGENSEIGDKLLLEQLMHKGQELKTLKALEAELKQAVEKSSYVTQQGLPASSPNKASKVPQPPKSLSSQPKGKATPSVLHPVSQRTNPGKSELPKVTPKEIYREVSDVVATPATIHPPAPSQARDSVMVKKVIKQKGQRATHPWKRHAHSPDRRSGDYGIRPSSASSISRYNSGWSYREGSGSIPQETTNPAPAPAPIAAPTQESSSGGASFSEESAGDREESQDGESSEEEDPVLTLDEAPTAVAGYLKVVRAGSRLSPAEIKAQGKVLLTGVEVLKKQEKSAYRLGWRLITYNTDISEAGIFLLLEKNKLHKANAARLRQLRRKLKGASGLTHPELTACKVKTKLGEAGCQTDSSDEEVPYSRSELGFRRGAMKGIAKALQAAPVEFITSFIELIVDPVTTITDLVESIKNLPELGPNLARYLESIEGNEAAKGEEIAQLLTSQLLQLAAPNKLKLLGQLNKLNKFGKALRITAEEAKKLGKVGRLQQGKRVQKGKKKHFRKGGGKNAQHANQSRIEAAKRNYEKALEEYEQFKKISGGEASRKKELRRLSAKVKHWRRKMEFTGENHTRNAKGNK